METPMFVKTSPRARMVQCTVCGRVGYPDQAWQEECIKDERFPCADCPLTFHVKRMLDTHRRHHRG